MATIYLAKFSVKEVSFSESTVGNLKNDKNTVTFDAPHWLDGDGDGEVTEDGAGDRMLPIAYVRKTKPTIETTIAVKPKGLTDLKDFEPEIMCKGPKDIEIAFKKAKVGEGEISLEPTESNGAFDDQVGLLEPMVLKWKVKLNDKEYDAGKTNNRTYVTLSDPKTKLRQESLFDIGCRNSKGKTSSKMVFLSIWADFLGPIPGVEKVDETKMNYWKTNNKGVCHGVQQLLASANGVGTCAAWAELLKGCGEALGVDDIDFIEVESTYRNDGNISLDGGKSTRAKLLIKNWDFADSGTAPTSCAPFSFYRNELMARAGSPGQDNENPPSVFFNHFIIGYDDKFYDPSYGVGNFKTESAWENHSVAAYERACQPGGADTEAFVVVKKNNEDELEVKFTIKKKPNKK